MTNTERLAQALRLRELADLFEQKCGGRCADWINPCGDIEDARLLRDVATLASLAPAAVEGDLNEQVKLFGKLKHLREFREFHLYRVIKTGNPGPQYTSGGGPSCRVKCWVCEQWVGEHYSTSTANYCVPCMKQCGSELSAMRNGDFETAERCRIELLEKYRDKCEQVAALTAQCATAGNYVCDKEVCPTSLRFADGRIVRLAHDSDHGYYLEIERESLNREKATRACR